MKNIIIISFLTMCFESFSMEERFRDFETHGIRLAVVNATDADITVRSSSGNLKLFDRSCHEPSDTIAVDGALEIEVAFRKGVSEEVEADAAIEIHQGEEDLVSLRVLQSPSPTLKRKLNKGLWYKLYSAKKGGGAEYYLVIARDKLSLSLYKPRNSSAQSYSEVDSSDSDNE
jgi:hypothetical protein